MTNVTLKLFYGKILARSLFFSALSKTDCELKIWNVWRVNDIVQAWVGNAGMVISEEGRIINLECSGGTDASML